MNIVCQNCGKKFEKLESEVNRSIKLGRLMFCSISCGAIYSASRILENKKRKYFESPKLCECCKSPLDYDRRSNRFCSSSCAARINNSLFPKKIKQQKSLKIDSSQRNIEYPVCIRCGKSCNKSVAKFCSLECSSRYRQDEIFIEIENGEKRNPWMMRKYLIEKRGCKCEECGWDKINQKTGKCPIELEHIDGNHLNNSLSNLKLLCPNCHSLTPTYKGANRGNGRHERMKRYNEGKSF